MGMGNPLYYDNAYYNAWKARSIASRKQKELTEEYQTAYNEAKAANEARYQQILTGYGTRYNQAMTGLGQSRTAITGQLASNRAELLSGIEGRGTNISGKLASNRAEVLGGLEGLGKEELAGIGRQYTRERASASQGLISSGLYSTTVAPAVLGGVGRREGYAVGAAQERLRRERLGHLSQLGTQELQAMERLGSEKLGYLSQLGAQELQALKEMSAQELMAKTGLKKEELDFMERRTDEYPSESLYVQLMQGLGGS